MYRGDHSKKLVSLITLALLITGMGGARALARVELHSPFKVEIRLERDVYLVDEPLEGEVLITNTYPTTIPAVFNIRTYHEGREESSTFTALKGVPLGTSKFSFQSFGVPPLTTKPDAEGSWRITIAQQNHEPSDTGQVTLKVVRHR